MKYLFLKSSSHQNPALEQKASDLFSCVEKKVGHSFTSGTVEAIKNEPFSIVYVATGGTAGMFKTALDSLKEPIIIVSSDSDNSLSASMEMMTYLANKEMKGRLLHGVKEEIATSIEQILTAIKAKNALNGLRLGLIGKPSDWLISTDFDYNIPKEKLGIEIIEIEMKELIDEISKRNYPDDKTCHELMAKNFDKGQIEKALEIYGAFSRLVDKYNLNGFSVRCFDLLSSVKNTGCLGLALLNQQGVYSGCEGDIPSLISMAILGVISGQPVFMCNPSRINKENNEIVFAHCTLPLNMPISYKLDTHFESGIGVSISGNIPSGSATVFKATGPLNRHFVSSATILESLHEKDLCRTQISLRCNEGVNKFYKTPVGNHYLVCLGDYSGHIEEFFNLL
ncbi:hypothetical protein [Schnuerera ultunensis]|uniref:hypothetical protein n=1 Tax=Schnuerera ultunensis TaxID=45497 RepID=UPI00041BC449|nr:hypothetical protein [Schnuerera ultunensis]